ncbi:MAG: threonylcarbamoyl-AMP synthase [Eubacterium sp.]|nr:threonylcarbamoyl-AMP synthase [Eubacterium sp.]
MKTKILTASEQDIAYAGEIIRSGGLVAFPTETVYGLGANALDEKAVKRIFEAKGRPGDNPLIIHIAEKEQLYPLVKEVTPKAKALVDAFFPAPLTIILKKSDIVPDSTSGGLDTVAVRMPENETARALIKASGVPIAAPSANTSGLPSPTKARYVIEDMDGKIDAIIDGEDCKIGVESTVITLVGEVPVILRPGAVTKEMLEAVIGRVEIANAVTEGMKESETAASPGMKYKHYSPRARVILVNAESESYCAFVKSAQQLNKKLYGEGFKTCALCFEEDGVEIPKVTFGKECDDSSQAKELFDALRRLDEIGAERVYARVPEKSGVALAVYNRLIRAAAFSIIDLKKPFLLGITGQTGAGKSELTTLSRRYFFSVVDSDRVAREVVENGSPVLEALSEAFGKDIIKDGALDRKRLAEIAFSSRENTEALNKIMHPEIIKRCKKLAKEKKAQSLVLLEAPQLFEAGLEKECYKIIALCADEKTRKERIKRRDSLTDGQAQSRINAQLSEQYYKEHSDYVIYNNGGLESLQPQFEEILKEII